MIISILFEMNFKKGNQIRQHQTTSNIPLIQLEPLQKLESNGMILGINSHFSKVGLCKISKFLELTKMKFFEISNPRI